MTKKRFAKPTALLTLLILVTSLFLGITIARYVTSTSSEDSARVAVWGINEAGPTTMDLFENEYKLEDGTKVAKSANENDKIIAPGLNGVSEFKIIKAKKAGLAPEVMYEVKISLDDSEIANEIKNHPGIQWKVDNSEWGTWDEFKANLLLLSGHESGVKTYAPGTVAPEFANGKTHTIAWQWIMDSGYDVEDTAMGNYVATVDDITAKLSITITAKQTDIDSTGMLEGNGSVYNTNDPQVLTFRADADYETFDSVEVDGTEIYPSNYETAPGSIIVKLNKDYLKSLSVGDHKIAIKTNDDKSIESKFTITNNTTIIHNGIIPDGGIYYVGIDPFYYEEWDDNIYKINNYDNYDFVYTAGDKFPSPQTGDVYVYGDYEYKYNYFSYPDGIWMQDEELKNGWGVRVLDANKSSYNNMLTTINGKNVKNLNFTYASSSNLINAPIISNKAEKMFATFIDCTNLKTAPIIPKSVNFMDNTFAYCTNLTGTIEINATLDLTEESGTNGENVLSGTSITWISGSMPKEQKELIAENSGLALSFPAESVKNGTYFHNVSEITKYLPEWGETATGHFYKDYSGAKTIIEPGETLPKTPKTGDIYVYGDYEYRYNMWYMGEGFIYEGGPGMDPSTGNNEWAEGWIAIVRDKTKTTYGEILTSIAGKPITMLPMTFAGCTNMTTAPAIPETVVSLYSTFEDCTNLITAPKIPHNVERMFATFRGCTNLEGPIEINTTKIFVDNDESCYSSYLFENGTTKIDHINDITGVLTNRQKHVFAQNAGIELFDPTRHHNNTIPTDAIYYRGVPTSNLIGNFTGYTNKYTTGTDFPAPVVGDRYLYNDIEYVYGGYATLGENGERNWKWTGNNTWGYNMFHIFDFNNLSHFYDVLEEINNIEVTQY